MLALVGRQPILDSNQQTVAYELLCRSSSDNVFDGTEGSEATTNLISSAFLSIGAHRLLGDKRGFINFTRALLLGDLALALPRESVVLEVLEDVECDEEVLAACRKLRAAGYTLALDDVTAKTAASPLAKIAGYAKIDWLASGAGDRQRLCSLCRQSGLRLIAEKVETREDFESARHHGCELFQGFFFARTEIVSARRVPTSSMACLRLLHEIQNRTLDFRRLEATVSKDVGLTQKLLFFVNSAAFAHHAQVKSLAQAFVMLGEGRIRHWVTLAAIPMLAAGKAAELVTLSLVRARFCELAAGSAGLRQHQSSCFLIGLLSLLDVMVGLPLDELIHDLGLEAHVADAILGTSQEGDPLRLVLELSAALERSDFESSLRPAAAVGIPLSKTAELYVDAMSWADAVQRQRPGGHAFAGGTG